MKCSNCDTKKKPIVKQFPPVLLLIDSENGLATQKEIPDAQMIAIYCSECGQGFSHSLICLN